MSPRKRQSSVTVYASYVARTGVESKPPHAGLVFAMLCTDGVAVFPNEGAIVRLFGALLLEQNEEELLQRAVALTVPGALEHRYYSHGVACEASFAIGFRVGWQMWRVV